MPARADAARRAGQSGRRAGNGARLMRVLVIGGTGFIGTRVVDDLVLRRHVAVRATVRDYRRAIRLARLPVELIRVDAANPLSLAGAAADADAVVLCAHPFGSAREDADAMAM